MPDPEHLGWREDSDTRTLRISERVDALTRPTTTREHQPVWNDQRRRWDHHPHVVVHRSLLEQLEDAAGRRPGVPADGIATRTAPSGHAPTWLPALDTLMLIEREARRLVRYALATAPTSTAAGNLQLLAARSHVLAPADLRDVDDIVLSWWARARIATGWDDRPWSPNVRCMACDALGTLRVKTAPVVALCVACGTAWDASTVGLLAEHIRAASE